MAGQSAVALAAALLLLHTAPLFSASSDLVPVKIAVETAEGQSVEGAYVALIPPDRPWNRPEAETIATNGTVILNVPEGDYRVVAGAPRKGTATSDRVKVLGSQKNELRVALRGVRTIAGTVRGEDGRPHSGVAVGDVHAFIEAPLGTLSELAARHLGSDWRTTSDAEGTWSLLLPTQSSNPLVAEAAGFGTAWRSAKASETSPVDLVLQRGGKARLTFDRVAPEFVVTLTTKGDVVSIPPAWETQVRARRVMQSSIEWASLAEGEYEIHAQQWDPRAFGKAVKLGTLTIQNGDTRELRLQLPVANSIPKSLARSLVRPIAGFNAESIESFGRDAAGAPRPVRQSTERVSGGTILYLDTTGLRAPYFGIGGDNRFVVLPLLDDARTSLASVVDRGGASLHVRPASDGIEPPTNGVATFHGCSSPETIALPVAVAKGNRVRFAAPAGCTGFVLDLEPFSPLVIAKQLPVGDEEWLGEFTLYAAGSAAVRVATDDGTPVAGAIVSISARTEGGLQDTLPVAEKSAEANGWAHFDRLPAGRELAIVARTAEGDRSQLEIVRIEPAQQIAVDPLRMPKAATLIIEPRLDAAVVRQFPGASIHAIFLERLDGKAEKRTERVGGKDAVEFARLVPGRWQIGALISAGRGMQPIWGNQIELASGESKRDEVLFSPLVFRGRVAGMSGDLSGNIDILGPLRSDVVPTVELSPAGEFVAVLPRRDTYFVGVRLRRTGQVHWIGNTPFTEPAQPVELRLPDGAITVQVRERGRPAAGATVMARMQHAPTADVPLIALPVKTGSDGRARLDGLLAGEWVVFVAGGQHAEAHVTVSNSETAQVELDVTDGLAIAGSVSDALGAPVADARLTCLLPGPNGVAYMRLAFTGSDGTFDLEDRAASRGVVLCSVNSVSGAQGFRVVPGEHARLVLPPNPATLHVTNLPAIDRFSGMWLVSRDGRLIEVSPYTSRTPGAAVLTIPAVAPDAWKLVRVSTPAEWLALTRGIGTLPALADVTLKPAERKTVELETAAPLTVPARR